MYVFRKDVHAGIYSNFGNNVKIHSRQQIKMKLSRTPRNISHHGLPPRMAHDASSAVYLGFF